MYVLWDHAGLEGWLARLRASELVCLFFWPIIFVMKLISIYLLEIYRNVLLIRNNKEAFYLKFYNKEERQTQPSKP